MVVHRKVCNRSVFVRVPKGDLQMTIIITMAGNGSRFQEAGYKMPKYEIEVKGKSLFEWSMDSLLGFKDPHVQYIFITRKENHAQDFLKRKCSQYGIEKYRVIELGDCTDGQATTCMYAIPYCNKKDSIFVYNIDTYVEPYEMNLENIRGDGCIPCFKAEGTHWSFVEADDMGRAIRVEEKERISDNCSVGAYYFKTSKLYADLYNEYYCDNQNMKQSEKYIAPLYNIMIRNKMDVRMQIINKEHVHILGTPEELRKFEEENK